VAGRLERADREVGRERPAEEVGEEAGRDVEEDEGREDGGGAEGRVGLGDAGLRLEAVEGLRAGNESARLRRVRCTRGK